MYSRQWGYFAVESAHTLYQVTREIRIHSSKECAMKLEVIGHSLYDYKVLKERDRYSMQHAACTVHVTVLALAVNSNQFQLYVVTRSYSSHLFLCALVLIQAVGFVHFAHKQLQQESLSIIPAYIRESRVYTNLHIQYTPALVSFPGCSCISLGMRQQQYVYLNLGRKQECVNWLVV